MLNPETERRICELLADKTPRREIARQTGASRATVDAIALGKRPINLSRSTPKQTEKPPSPVVGRCPICHRQIELPCKACAAEAFRRDNPRPRPLRPDPPLQLGLTGHDRQRYEDLQSLGPDDPLPEE